MQPLERTSSTLPAILLTLILLLLGFRLTCTETQRETIPQKATRLEAQLNPSSDAFVAPEVGAPFTATYLTAAFLLAAATAWCARTTGLTPARLGQAALILAILGLLLASTLNAANRFAALQGTADIATALLCAWAITLLCSDALLGDRGRHAVIATIIAALSMGCAKAAVQHFIEYPDLAKYINEHKEEALRRAGVSNDPYQVYLFMGRVNSREPTGFGAMTNAFASQLIALAGFLFALCAAAFVSFRQPRQKTPAPTTTPAAGRKAATPQDSPKQEIEIPLPLIAAAALAIILISSLLLLPLTHSTGGMGSMAITLTAIILGTLTWKFVIRRRITLTIAAALLAIAGAAGIIAYGISNNGLPTLSLLYRWHYWTGAWPIITQSPALGVGFYNFGDYYLAHKLPYSPEDVKDPHSFFVRLLAEAGVPATLLITALIVCWIRSLWKKAPAPPPQDEETSLVPPMTLAAVAAVVWIPLHLLTEGNDSFTSSMTMIYAVLGWAVFAATLVVLREVTAHSAHVLTTTRYITLAGLIAALGMFFYDQVNMALVTGPVAMLFWVLLALADSHLPGPPSKASRPAGMLLAAGSAVAAITTATLYLLPVAQGRFQWDPAPHEFAYLRQIMLNNNAPAALESLDRAIPLSPNSIELLMQRITLKRDRLKLPVADDIRRVVSLDRANARIRLDVALPETDLPAAERIAILEEALKLNATFPEKEPKRLTPEHLQRVNDALTRLRTAGV